MKIMTLRFGFIALFFVLSANAEENSLLQETSLKSRWYCFDQQEDTQVQSTIEERHSLSLPWKSFCFTYQEVQLLTTTLKVTSIAGFEFHGARLEDYGSTQGMGDGGIPASL